MNSEQEGRWQLRYAHVRLDNGECAPPDVVGGCNLHRRMAALCKQYCNAASLFPFLFLVITLGPGAYIRGYRGFS